MHLMEPYIILGLPICALCISFRHSCSDIEEQVSVIFEQYFKNELTLGLVYACDERLVSMKIMKTHLPVIIHNLANLTSDCYGIVNQCDGFVLFTFSVILYSADFFNFIQCLKQSEMNYKMKKIVIVDVLPLNKQHHKKHIYLHFFHHIWIELGLVHIIVLPILKGDSGFELTHVLAYNPFLPGHSQMAGGLLVFDLCDNFVVSLENRFLNMHGYPLNVSMFPFGYNVQEALVNRSNSIQGGKDLMLKWTIESQFNLTLVPQRPKDNQLHGYFIRGKPFGSLADIINNLVEFTVNNAGTMFYNTPHIQHLQPDEFDSIIVVVRKKPSIETWMIFLVVFQHQVWFGIFVTIIVVCTFYVLFENAYSFMYYTQRAVLSKEVVLALKSLLSIAVKQVPQQTSGRILMASSLLFSIIIVNLFLGQIYTLMKLKPRPTQVNSLQELLGYNIITQHVSFANIFDTYQNSSFWPLRDMIRYKNNTDHFISDLSENDAYLDSRLYIVANVFNGSVPDDFHVLKETVNHYFLGHIMPVTSIYYDQFNLLILKVIQSGLFYKWIQESLLYSRKHISNNYKQKNKSSRPTNEYILTNKDLKLSFDLLFAGLCISSLCFLIELIVNKYY